MVTEKKSGPGDVFTFTNWVSSNGYEIELARGTANTSAPRSTSELLATQTEREIRPRGVDLQRRHPMHESENIARELARIGDADADVLAFVDRFGLLYPPEGTRPNTVESFLRARDAVRGVVKKIDATNKGKLDSHERREALRGLSDWFNRTAAPAFTFGVRVPNSKTGNRALRIVADSLLSAVGLQLAYEISGEIEWKRCAQCAKMFPAGSPGDRVQKRNAAVCSTLCGQRLKDSRKASIKAASPPLAPRACVNCGNVFTPKRETTVHCGKPACKMAVSRAKKPAQAATTKGKK